MSRNPHEISAGNAMVSLNVLLNAIVLKGGLIAGGQWYRFLPVTAMLLLASLFVLLKKKQ
jgi:hypothetical protein